jgi:hypothetical protein
MPPYPKHKRESFAQQFYLNRLIFSLAPHIAACDSALARLHRILWSSQALAPLNLVTMTWLPNAQPTRRDPCCARARGVFV